MAECYDKSLKVVVMTFKCSQTESGLTVFLESLIIPVPASHQGQK